MALKIAREVIGIVFAPPYSMHVLTCDHSGPSRSEAHDLLLSPLPNHGTLGEWPPGLYSFELVCRDVGRERGFNWAETLCNEALPLFSEEQKCQGGLLRGRILILAQMRRPCYSGYSLHGLAMRKGSKYWERLFGWEQFDLSAVVAPSPKKKEEEAKPQSSHSARPNRQLSPTPSLEEQWEAFVMKCVGTDAAQAPDWIKLAPALRNLRDPPLSSLHGKRYLDPKVDGGSACWKRADGGWPRKSIDWKYSPGKRGGGNAGQGGPIVVRKAFLKSVYVMQYARK